MFRYILLVLSFLVTGEVKAQAGWQKQVSPVKEDLHKIFFASDSVGWITTHDTGKILHTRDGGNSWYVQESFDPFYIESIHFLDEETGWLSGQYGLTFKTTDGGETWEEHKIAGNDSWVYSVYFHGKNKGLAVGMREGKSMLPLVLTSGDGGENWDDPSTKLPNTAYTSIHFLTKEEGYITGAGYILKTINGGSTWETEFTSTTESACEMIRAIYFTSSEKGWAVGHCGKVLKTENDGQWVEYPSFTKNRLRDIAFVTEKEGYIVGDANNQPGVLYQTKDGGASWKVKLTDSPDLHDIEVTDSRIWVIGKEGAIFSKSK